MILNFEVYVTLGSYNKIKQELSNSISEIVNHYGVNANEIKIIFKEE